MDKEFVTYEQAVALKELGFNEPCLGWYDEGGNLYIEMQEYLAAPLKQQVFRWFREKYGLYGVVDGLEKRLYYSITQLNSYSKEHDTYEEAEDACIDKLIQLVKNE